MNKNYKLKELADIGGLESAKPKEPAWILWEGGKCPLPDTVKKWEVRFRDQQKIESASSPSQWRWSHNGFISDIVAYRVWPE